jgi:DNA-binding LacI/PurR family transcriptional regulator
MQSGAEVARALVAGRKRFDGIFCVTDTVAIGVLRGLADAGVRVPSGVKVIGFDNVEESAFTVPSLSSIDPDHERMARTAVSLLVRRIEGVPGRPRREFVSKFSVVERESTHASTVRACR